MLQSLLVRRKGLTQVRFKSRLVGVPEDPHARAKLVETIQRVLNLTQPDKPLATRFPFLAAANQQQFGGHLRTIEQYPKESDDDQLAHALDSNCHSIEELLLAVQSEVSLLQDMNTWEKHPSGDGGDPPTNDNNK